MKASYVAILLVLVVAALPAAGDASSASPVVLTRLDGTTLTGTLEGLDPTGLRVRTAGGAETVPVDDVSGVAFPGAAQATPRAEADWVFHLSAGGRLAGALLSGEREKVVVRTQLADRTEFRFAQLAAAVRRDAHADRKAQALFDAARTERLPGQDVLIARDAEGAKALRGTLLELGPETGEFVFNGRPHRLQTDKIYAVAFAAAPAAPEATATVHLRGGDVLCGTLDGAAAGALEVGIARGQRFVVPFDRLASLELRSPRVVHVSDLAPVAHKSAGLVQGALPYRRDRNVGNGPLVLAGTAFAKGLGVHARSELVYELDGPYETFAATIGIDDAVRPGGCVEFAVLADGVQVFASGPLTGADRPREILVPLKGVNLLTLIVDFAANADVGDWADWAAARLIKPKETRW